MPLGDIARALAPKVKAATSARSPSAAGGSGDDPTRVMRLFAMRRADRMGQLGEGDMEEYEEMARFGEGLGVARVAMPGRPQTTGDAVPAGDSLSSLAPPPGSRKTGQTDLMASRSAPTAPAMRRNGLMPSGIPALDELAEAPQRRTRGLVHDRKLGRVRQGG